MIQLNNDLGIMKYELVGPMFEVSKIKSRKRKCFGKKKSYVEVLVEWKLEGEYSYSWEPERQMYKQVPDLMRAYFKSISIRNPYRRKKLHESTVKTILLYDPRIKKYKVIFKPELGMISKWISKLDLEQDCPKLFKRCPK